MTKSDAKTGGRAGGHGERPQAHPGACQVRACVRVFFLFLDFPLRWWWFVGFVLLAHTHTPMPVVVIFVLHDKWIYFVYMISNVNPNTQTQQACGPDQRRARGGARVRKARVGVIGGVLIDCLIGWRLCGVIDWIDWYWLL